MSQKREQLIQTGEELLVKHGMRRVTVEEICRRAGVSKPTFYRFFANKEDLARKIDERWIENALQRAKAIEAGDQPFPQKLQQILALKLELAALPGPEFLQDLIDLEVDLSHAFRHVLAFLENSQQAGDIRDDIRPELLLAAFDRLNSLQHDPRIRAAYPDAESLAEDVFKLFHFGVLAVHHRETELD